MINDFEEFENFRKLNIHNFSHNQKEKHIFQKASEELFRNKYTYNFDWLGLPIIQYPQDIVALQEIVWNTKPDVIIETGIARGGSIIFYASMLHLLNGDGKVIGVDIDIREHNRKAIENHSLSFRVKLVQGSSVDTNIVDQVKSLLKPNDRVMVVLDSNHTHDHVLKELEMYNSLVSKDCYLVVLDTYVEDLPNELFNDRPWSKGNNPKTAVHQFIKTTDRFEIDESVQNKLLITVAPDGYLKCVK